MNGLARATWLLSGLLALLPAPAAAQALMPDLARIADPAAWHVMRAVAEPALKQGQPALRLVSEGDSANGIVGLALPHGVAFATGAIEIDLKGRNIRQRSFLGVAFNVVDERTFEAVYFRPFNFRAEAPFRGRAVQYIAWPGNTWEHLRQTQPGRFEQPLDPPPDPDGWFHARIEVAAAQVRVFVNHAKQPSLVVPRLAANGTTVERRAGLFVDSADGFYANLRIEPALSPAPEPPR